MKSIAKLVALLLGSAIFLSGCSAVSSMLFGDSKGTDSVVQEPSTDAVTVETAINFTFYDSFANW